MESNNTDKLKTEFNKDFIKSQIEIKALKKDMKGYGYKYADLSQTIFAIKDVLNNNHIGFMQSVERVEDGYDLITYLIHKNGYEKVFRYPVIESKVAKSNDVQSFGSSVTYSKRYSLQAICGVPTEDDDGASASKTYHQQQKEPNKKDYSDYKFKKGEYEGLSPSEVMNIDYLTNLINQDKTPDGLKEVCIKQVDKLKESISYQ